MRPLIFFSIMCRDSAWEITNAASRFTASISRHCSKLAPSTVCDSCRRGLAQCTKIDTLPSRWIASAASLSAVSFFVRSNSMSARITRPPSASSASAMPLPLPMPFPAPVTSAVSPSSSFTSDRPLLHSRLGALRGEALARLCRLDHEAHVLAAPALLDRVLHRKSERDLAPVDFRNADLDRDLEPERRGGEVVDRDVRADRILALVEMLQQPVAARIFD